jgi:hypothetical protein
MIMTPGMGFTLLNNWNISSRRKQLVDCYWLLVAGCLLLVAGCWLLV